MELEAVTSGSGGGGITVIDDDNFQLSMTANTSLNAVFEASGGETVLYINEFLARNSMLNADEAGEFDDWIEIYNPGSQAIDIGGMYITDDLTVPDRYRISSSDPEVTTISPGGYLLLWADKDLNQGPLHLNIRLAGNGESIGLFRKENNQYILLDSVTYPSQQSDLSYGRYPDGTGEWEQFFNTQSPGERNTSSMGINDIQDITLQMFQNFPNPFTNSTRIKFILSKAQSVNLSILDLAGRIIKTRNFGKLGPGIYYDYDWDGTDNSGKYIPSGLYIISLTGDNFSVYKKASYVRN